MDSTALDIKPQPLRRLTNAVVVAFLDANKQVTEKSWRLSLEALLIRAAGLRDFPFSVHGIILEALQQELAVSKSVITNHVGVVRLSLALLTSMVRRVNDNKNKRSTTSHHEQKQEQDQEQEQNQEWLVEQSAHVRAYAHLIGESLLLLSDDKVQREVVAKIGELVKGSTSNLAVFLAAWIGDGSQTSPSTQQFLFIAAALAVLPFVPSGHSQQQQQQLKTSLLAHYLTSIVQHKNPALLSVFHLKMLESVVGTITESDWMTGSEDGVEGALLKVIKKAPEGSSLLTAAAVSQLKGVSLAAFAQNGGMAAAIRMLRSQALGICRCRGYLLR